MVHGLQAAWQAQAQAGWTLAAAGHHISNPAATSAATSAKPTCSHVTSLKQLNS